jgi:phthiodiolone/phenolphthiodiolone dimycocerosates ketoreductase
VDEALSSNIMKVFALNVAADVWARHGASHPLGDDFTGAQDIIPQTLDEETAISSTAHVPLSLMKECLLSGPPDDVIDQAAEWRDHGLQYPVVCNVSALQPSLRRGLAATAPFMRVLRKLRQL